MPDEAFDPSELVNKLLAAAASRLAPFISPLKSVGGLLGSQFIHKLSGVEGVVGIDFRGYRRFAPQPPANFKGPGATALGIARVLIWEAQGTWPNLAHS